MRRECGGAVVLRRWILLEKRWCGERVKMSVSLSVSSGSSWKESLMSAGIIVWSLPVVHFPWCSSEADDLLEVVKSSGLRDYQKSVSLCVIINDEDEDRGQSAGPAVDCCLPLHTDNPSTLLDVLPMFYGTVGEAAVFGQLQELHSQSLKQSLSSFPTFLLLSVGT